MKSPPYAVIEGRRQQAYLVFMRRGKKQKLGIAVRMHSLREIGLGISHNGREFKPGSEEYDRKLKQLAESLSEEEFQSIIAAGKGKL